MFVSLPDFEYLRPKSLDEALELLDDHAERARVLAGGTDLMVDMRSRVLSPEYVIDVKGISQLHELRYERGAGFTIGAAVPLNEVMGMLMIKERYRALYDALEDMGDEILRNRATLVGNICNASPAADTAAPLLVLDAQVEVSSVNGKRVLEIKDFFKGVKGTTLEPNEVVTAIHVPEPPDGSRSRYLKAKRTSEDLAIVGVAALVANEDDPKNRIVRLAYSSVAPTPVRAFEVEEALRSDRPIPDLVDRAVSIALTKVSPISDVRAGREYRIHLVELLTRLVLKELLGGA